jgi:sulfite reductase (NADPH) flavoprotein alpha-component
LTQLHRDGRLSHLDLAFSRDQRAKVFVQDRMRERGARRWAWLQDGAGGSRASNTATCVTVY